MRESKSTLITIVVLLAIFAPLAIYGTISHINGPSTDLEQQALGNPNKEFYYNGQLYFYGPSTGELMATYDCVSEECGGVKTSIDDDAYLIDYYKDGEDSELVVTTDQLALFQDGNNINVFMYFQNASILKFAALKNYGTKLENNVVIAKQGRKWGVISLDNFQTVINYEYDFLGLKNDFNEQGELNTDHFIAFKEYRWFLVGYDGVVESVGVQYQIRSYNDNYIVTENGYVYDYDGNNLTENISTKDAYIVGDYVVLVNEYNMLQVYRTIPGMSVATYNVGEYDELTFSMSNDNALNVYKDGVILTTLALV